jgi:hypothetical protein
MLFQADQWFQIEAAKKLLYGKSVKIQGCNMLKIFFQNPDSSWYYLDRTDIHDLLEML